MVGLDSGDRLDVVQVPLTYRSAPLAGAPTAAVVGVARLRARTPGTSTTAPTTRRSSRALLGALRSDDGAVAGARRRALAGAERRAVEHEHHRRAGRRAARDRQGVPHPAPRRQPRRRGARRPHPRRLARTCPPCAAGSWARGCPPSGGAPVDGHLAVAVEFLPGSEDAWRVALGAVRSGADFAAPARDLGAATAQVHADLAAAFGTTAGRRGRPRAHGPLAAGAPGLGPLRRARPRRPRRGARRARRRRSSTSPACRRCSASTATSTSARCCRRPARAGSCSTSRASRCARSPSAPCPTSPCATWPACSARSTTPPATTPSAPAARVPAPAPPRPPPPTPPPWPPPTPGPPPPATPSARATAPSPAATPASQADLLRALTLDKALYEVVYEARNRPTWLRIPLTAVARLLG